MLKIGLLVAVGVLNLGVALLVLGRNIRKPLNFSYFLLATSVAIWIFGIAAFLHVQTTELALLYAKVYYIAPLLIGFSSVVFAEVFPSGGVIRKQIAYALGIGVVCLSVLVLLPNCLFTGVVYHSWGKEVILNKTTYALYSAYLAIAFFLTLASVYAKTKHERGIYNAQAVTFFDGYLVSCVLGVYFNLILPGLGNYRLIWLGPLATTVYIVATAYGIVRHRLFDIRLIVARSLGYIAAIVTLSFLYGFVVFGLAQAVFGANVDLRVQIFFSAATGIVALSFQRFKSLFDKVTNKIFYRDAYDSQVLFDDFNKALVSTIDLDELLTRTSKIIAQHLKADYCMIGVKDGSEVGYRIVGTVDKHFAPEDIARVRQITRNMRRTVIVTDDLTSGNENLHNALMQNDIAVMARLTTSLKVGREGLGYLVLGAKRSGSLYNSQDVKVIEVIANELIIAVQNALHFEEIQRFNETLQEKIEVATRQLRETNAKLKRIDKQKDDFIGMASHQLRTPLTSIKGYVSLVLDGDSGKITATQRKLLEQAFTSSQRMVYLIADLLNVSRLKSGKFVIERVPTNLSKVISDEMAQLKTAAASHDIELIFHPPAHFPTLMLDETKTRQVIMNFLDNAIYYTPNGGHITVTLRDLPKSIEFEVLDDGIGVPKAERHHLFTKFYRAKNAQRARPDGTGLGLFMAQKVIIAQGGAIIFDSQEGVGSKFGFSFPKDISADMLKPTVVTE